MNQALIDYFQDLLEMVSQTGIINIDFADLQTILKGKGQKVFLVALWRKDQTEQKKH